MHGETVKFIYIYMCVCVCVLILAQFKLRIIYQL